MGRLLSSRAPLEEVRAALVAPVGDAPPTSVAGSSTVSTSTADKLQKLLLLFGPADSPVSLYVIAYDFWLKIAFLSPNM